jgi:hypothetical protein
MITRIYLGLAWLVVAGMLVESYLAGTRAFRGNDVSAAQDAGISLAVAMLLLLLVLALAARPGRRTIGMAAVLVILAVVQVLLPSLRTAVPWVAALHPINAVALAMVAATRSTETLVPATSGP